MLGALIVIVLYLIQLYQWVIIAAVISSWLVGFGIVNSYNPTARTILRALHGLTEPVFGPIRRIIPAIGGLDLSPFIAYLITVFLDIWIRRGTFL